MAGAVRVTRGLTGNSAFARHVTSIAAAAAAKKLRTVMDTAVTEANSIVAAEFANDRDGFRRKKGDVHLLGSFYCQIIWDGRNFPVTLVMRSRANIAKVSALEYGAKPHEITAHNGGRLAFPVAVAGKPSLATSRRPSKSAGPRPTTSRATARTIAGIRFDAAANSGNLLRPQSVSHPGNAGARMMERGLERAVLAAFRKSVKAGRVKR